jgi:hypothetical protein
MLKEKRDRDAALPSERAIPKKKKNSLLILIWRKDVTTIGAVVTSLKAPINTTK